MVRSEVYHGYRALTEKTALFTIQAWPGPDIAPGPS